MVKVHKKEKGRQGWCDTVKAIAKSANATITTGSPAPRRRETRKRASKSKKAQSRWVEEMGADIKAIQPWARLDVFLDAPKESKMAILEESDDDAFEEDDEDEEGNATAKGRAAKRKAKAKPKRAKKSKTGQSDEDIRREKRHRPRTLSQVILDDFAPSRGAKWDADLEIADYVTAAARPTRRPPHRVCIVTGAKGTYADPETGLYFSDAEAGALLRDNPPPWLNLGKNHGSPYYEALLQVRTERSESPTKRKQDEEDKDKPRYYMGQLLAPGQNPGDPDPPGWYRGKKFE